VSSQGTAPPDAPDTHLGPETPPAGMPVVEVRVDRDDPAIDDELLTQDEVDVGTGDDVPVSATPLVQARRYVVDTDPLDQARRFEVVRQSIAERSAARRFELAVDPPEDTPTRPPTPRGAPW
jgi:hypothetical protein